MATPSSSGPDADPLVSIGLPVRNGEVGLSAAIDSLLAQTYPNIEIVISDGASTDRTEDIGRSYADAHANVQYHRQTQRLTIVGNHRFVLDHSRGPLFMWHAHDDVRSPDSVEAMVRSLAEHPDAAVAITANAQYDLLTGLSSARPMATDPESFGLSFYGRLLRYCAGGNIFYGLFRRYVLLSYPWIEVERGPETPVILFVVLRGEVVAASQGTFYYGQKERPSPNATSLEHFQRPLRRGHELRHCRHLTQAVMAAQGSPKLTRRSLPVFLVIFGARLPQTLRMLVYHSAAARRLARKARSVIRG